MSLNVSTSMVTSLLQRSILSSNFLETLQAEERIGKKNLSTSANDHRLMSQGPRDVGLPH